MKQRNSRIVGFFYFFVMATSTYGIVQLSNGLSRELVARLLPGFDTMDIIYRLEFASLLLSSFGTLVLAYASYLIVASLNPKLSLVVLITRSAEAVLFAVFAIVRFVFLFHGPHTQGGYDLMYSSPKLAPLQVVGEVVYNVATLCFCAGSMVFFYLLLKPRYIPRFLPVLGLAATLVVLVDCLPNLLYGSTDSADRLSWVPIALAEILIASWLLVVGVRVDRHARTENQ